jgi:hypothetical protein
MDNKHPRFHDPVLGPRMPDPRRPGFERAWSAAAAEDYAAAPQERPVVAGRSVTEPAAAATWPAGQLENQ